jgi:hypothetical protein
LLAVLIAAIVAFSGNNAPLALVGDGFADPAVWIGGIAFAASIAVLYGWLIRLSRSATAS